MKIESRFLVVAASIIAGCAGGLWYFECGNTFEKFSQYTMRTSENEVSESALQDSHLNFPTLPSHLTAAQKVQAESTPTMYVPGKILEQKPACEPTLYQLTSRMEAEENEKKSTETLAISGAPVSATVVPEAIRQTAEVPVQVKTKVTSENAELLLTQMAEGSTALAESLKDLAEMSKTTVQTPAKPQHTQKAERKALICVSDFQKGKKSVQKAETSQESASRNSSGKKLNPFEEKGKEEPELQTTDFLIESEEEAQKALAGKLGANEITEVFPALPEPEGSMDVVSVHHAIGSAAKFSESSLRSENTSPADDLDENPIVRLFVHSDENPVEQAETEYDEDSEETESEAVEPETRENDEVTASPTEIPQSESPEDADSYEVAPSAGPSRLKKPSHRHGEKHEYVIGVQKENIRKALATFQIETGLKVVASLDVQGEVTCHSRSEDPEILLTDLLTGTPFKYARSGKFVYIAHSKQMQNLPTPLERVENRFYVPKNIPVEELEFVFAANLTQFGTYERTRDEEGNEGLRVTDWVLSLNQLEEIQKVVDLPKAENRLQTFVFQHELNVPAKPLELLNIAENRGLVLQQMSIPGQKSEKKNFLFQKKNQTEEIQAYSISLRAETFMHCVKEQLGVQVAQMPAQTSAPMELNQQMEFDFNLNVDGNVIPYQITVTFRENEQTNPTNESTILAEISCTPKEKLDSKSKPRNIQFTLPMPSGKENTLILQLDLGDFACTSPEKKKNPAYAWVGNHVKKEVVIAFCPCEEQPQGERTKLTTKAVREIIHQQEVLGRKFYGSIDRDERENSSVCFGIAQRVRKGLGETLESDEP